MIIVIYAGYQSEPLNPSLINTTGLGGTEQCIINLAQQFALDEHSVYVTGQVENGDYQNVKYRNQILLEKELNNKKVDWVIGVSYINYLLELNFLNFDKSFFWIHNTDFYPWFRGKELENKGEYLLYNDKMTYIVCLTEWHKNKFVSQFPKISNKVIVIGNGINKSAFVKPKQKNKDSFIYTSHAERGLSIVLENWNHIKKIKPDATLHIATPNYGLEFFEEHYADYINNFQDIKFYGSLPQRQLYDLMSQCEYWYYPTDYEETFCITALEMLGHNVTPIATEVAALKETLSDFNLKSLKNISKKLDFQKVSNYIETNDWSCIKKLWDKYIFIMENQNNKNFELDCVYVISLNVNQSLIDTWTNDIRQKLMPWYKGPIVCKKATNGAKIDNEWLKTNNYSVYDNWKLENHPNSFWSNDVTPGELGCGISHHKIWKHAHKNNFKNILVLEDDFDVKSRLTYDLVSKLPKDYDLFYLGRNPIYNWQGHEFQDIPTETAPFLIPAPSFNSHAYLLSFKGVSKLLSLNFNKNIFAVDDFLIASSVGHVRPDLNFIDNKISALALESDLVSQNRPSEESGPRVEIPSVKSPYLHPDLYSYYDDPDGWKEKFITYSARTQEWELIMDEPFDNCFSMPLFTQEFCEKIREEAEHSNKWTTDRHEYYPTTDMLLNELNYEGIYYEVLREYVIPASIHAFQLDGKGWDDMASEDFLAKYVPHAQGHLSLHHDHSNITALVTLSNFEEYEGGGTYFSHQKKLIKEKQGYVSIHPGNITHKHGARATTKGTRYIIVSFMKNTDFMK